MNCYHILRDMSTNRFIKVAVQAAAMRGTPDFGDHPDARGFLASL
jgi:hypothetical protein